ncbi:hypothetical protein KCU65_g7654, partial [Aureobasidium melanogenum]
MATLERTSSVGVLSGIPCSGENNILACKKCYYNWDHFKKKYLVNQPPEIKCEHWARFVKHQKSGVTSVVGNFKWTEHDCEICGAEANLTPPPGYPDNNVKLPSML